MIILKSLHKWYWAMLLMLPYLFHSTSCVWYGSWLRFVNVTHYLQLWLSIAPCAPRVTVVGHVSDRRGRDASLRFAVPQCSSSSSRTHWRTTFPNPPCGWVEPQSWVLTHGCQQMSVHCLHPGLWSSSRPLLPAYFPSMLMTTPEWLWKPWGDSDRATPCLDLSAYVEGSQTTDE